MTPVERQNYARNLFKEYPDQFPTEHRELILHGQITLGMAPFEARLAGGAFSYKVIADPKRWPPHTNPLDVMWQQSVKPDDSEIWMTFTNKTQYPDEPERQFRVHFQRGKAVDIQKLETAS